MSDRYLYHQNCRANRIWFLRWPVPKRVMVWLDHGPRWMGRWLYWRGLSRMTITEDTAFGTRAYRCQRCWLWLHEDL